MEKAAGLSEDCAGKIYSGPLKREEQTMKIYDLSQEVFFLPAFFREIPLPAEGLFPAWKKEKPAI